MVGFFSDKTNSKLGKRTPWYIFGTIFVVPTFLGIFIYPVFESEMLRIAYYVTLPALFNIGKYLINYILKDGQVYKYPIWR